MTYAIDLPKAFLVVAVASFVFSVLFWVTDRHRRARLQHDG